MSSLIRRMQRMASRSKRAKKAAINRRFATAVGVKGRDTGKPLLKPGRKPRALRRSKRSQQWLERRSTDLAEKSA